jgi:hypothetical protein
MTLQDVFEQCANSLLNQKRRSMYNGLCAYFTTEIDADGNEQFYQCGAAPVLKSLEVKPRDNTTSFTEICDFHPDFFRDDIRESFYNPVIEEFDVPFVSLVAQIQNVHDNAEVCDWQLELQAIAHDFELDILFLKQRVEG